MKSKSSNQTSAVWNLPFNQNKTEIQVFETKKKLCNKTKKKDNVHIFIFSHRFTAKVNSLVLMYLKQTLKKKKTTFIFSFSLIALPPKLTRLF